MAECFDVVIVGAGAAGLAAAGELANSGLKTIVLEARSRIGGRIYTRYDPAVNIPIELGAEFIHGKSAEIWKPLQSRGVPITEVEGDAWCLDGQNLSRCSFFKEVEGVLDKMDAKRRDESFLRFLQRCFPEAKSVRQKETLDRAIRYVTGFNAADPNRVGVHWLVKGMEAEEKIQGDRAFRPKRGYQALLDIMLSALKSARLPLQTGTVVSSIAWKRGRVDVRAHSLRANHTFTAKAVLVTLPIGVLKAAADEVGGVRFAPVLPQKKLRALEKLEMGQAARVVLRFRWRFWGRLSGDGKKNLAKMGFLFSDDKLFPTWWSAMPDKYPILTGWAPFHSAETLSAEPLSGVRRLAVETIAKLLNLSPGKVEGLLEAVYFHDWRNDRFSRGAYSYGTVGADGAQEALASPVENTLFFAGEATDVTGNNGTVHGAISSGRRAAREIAQAYILKRAG